MGFVAKLYFSYVFWWFNFNKNAYKYYGYKAGQVVWSEQFLPLHAYTNLTQSTMQDDSIKYFIEGDNYFYRYFIA